VFVTAFYPQKDRKHATKSQDSDKAKEQDDLDPTRPAKRINVMEKISIDLDRSA
jgi:hypothetical protein